ncbi:sodium/chloride symporter [Chloropicon primus]|uniref:Sodium/chloride symporter n=1 Tax=Chloropicon primus TaxID=1764295 RepID=A0A5B8MYJ6_9CHLO|nr:sodium/chloride symporter [Chloropicon primus]UPR03899.1 sodium/chloride symporter [Chloropicon primus]|eukprot:QDZ24692.1 sodium/chloride symporter [Chloropicon primus]
MTARVSWSGTLTLVAIVLVGPALYLVDYLWKKWRGVRATTASEGSTTATTGAEDDDEQSDSELLDRGHPSDSFAEHGAAEAREKWSSSQYLFGLIGYAIGIGNVWRFCYVIARDGGAASLLAYLVSFLFIATPLFLYEMVLGQYTRLSALPAWVYVRPRWIGLGCSQFLLCFIVQSYFVMIIAYTIPYIYGSCLEPLPWTEEGKTAEEHWFVDILGAKTKDDGEDLIDASSNTMQTPLLLSYAGLWLIIYFSIAFGKEVLSKITYVTVIAPCVLVVVLIIRAAFLPGAMDGIRYYIFKFETDKLLDLNVWAAALSQCLFSLSPGFGTAITMSSHTKDREDVYMAALITSCANTLFAVAAGFAVFAILGNLAYQENEEVSTIASRSGTGLAFIVIASAMPTFGPSAANVMSVLFFVMLFTLGLDSAYAWSETLTATVADVLEEHDYKVASWKISAALSAMCFLAGLPYCYSWGTNVLDSMDNFVGTNFLLFICFVESVVFMFDFSFPRLEYALRLATDGKRSMYPKYGCYFDLYLAIPISTLGLFIYQLYFNATSDVLPPGNKSIEVAGWVMMSVLVVLTGFGLWRRGKGQLSPLPPLGQGIQLSSLHSSQTT